MDKLEQDSPNTRSIEATLPFTPFEQVLVEAGSTVRNFSCTPTGLVNLVAGDEPVLDSGQPLMGVSSSATDCQAIKIETVVAAEKPPELAYSHLMPIGTRIRGRMGRAVSLCWQALKIGPLLDAINRFRLPVRALLAPEPSTVDTKPKVV